MSFPVSHLYKFDEFELNVHTRQFQRGGVPVALSPKGFEVLTYLVRNPGRVILKEELLQAIWPGSFVEESSLAQQISLLRKAMTDRAGYIATIPGRGYQFTGTVQAESSGTLVQQHGSGQVILQTVRERTHLVVDTPVALLPVGRQPISAVKVSLWAAAFVAVVLGGWLGWGRYRHPPLTAPLQLVLVDFVNTTGDGTFDYTLRRALEVSLEQSPYMDVMSERTGVGTLQMMGLPGETPLTANVAREVCERANRKILIAGNLSSVGPHYLLTLEATDCVKSKRLASVKAEVAGKGDVLSALDTLAGQMRSKLGESSKSLANFQVPLREATTSSLEALKAYSTGKYLLAQGKSDLVLKPLYLRAVELDPQFAMAYGELAIIDFNAGEVESARKYMTLAYENSGHVTAKEKFVIQAHYLDQALGDMLRANDAYQVWGETYPGEWVPWVDICGNDIALGLYEQAIPAGERALKLGPDRSVNYSVLMRAYAHAGRFEDAKRLGQLAIQLGRNSVGVNETLAAIAYAEHDAKGLAAADAWIASNPDDWYSRQRKAEALATSGRYRQAVAMFTEAYDLAKFQKLDETADSLLIDRANVELSMGLNHEARATLARMHPDEGNADRDLVLLRIKLGDTGLAQRFLGLHKTDQGTYMRYITIPQVQSLVDQQDGKPMEALAAMGPAEPYALESFSIPTQLAEIYLRAGQAEQAAEQYKKILASEGVCPNCPQYPLAHLGLARTYERQGNHAGSRKEYEEFFAATRDADPGLPVLELARSEFSRLQGNR